MKQFIEELKKVDEQLSKEGYAQNTYVRRTLLNCLDEMEQALQQTPCSTLRELLEQKLIELQQKDNCNNGLYAQSLVRWEIQAFQTVLQSMFPPPPVA